MLNNKLTFLIGCIGFRICIALYAKNTSPDILRIMGYISIIPAIGFIYIYMNGLRKTGFEAGGKIWWNNMRPIHGVLYLLFAMYAIKQESYAWLILLLDAILGFLVWNKHHFAIR